jgi:hypothetical protein
LRKVWWQAAASQLNLLQNSLKQHSHQPDYWSADITAYASELRQSLVDPQSIIGKDVVAAFGAEKAPAKQLELIRQFGELLTLWPQLKDAAADLHQRQGCVGERIRSRRRCK